MGLKEWLAGRVIAHEVEEARMGKLGAGAAYAWRLLDGWKSWIVAVIATYKLMCASCATAGYLAAVQHALGWDSVTGAFDPSQFAAALAVIVALWHHLYKGVQQYSSGVPLDKVHP